VLCAQFSGLIGTLETFAQVIGLLQLARIKQLEEGVARRCFEKHEHRRDAPADVTASSSPRSDLKTKKIFCFAFLQ